MFGVATGRCAWRGGQRESPRVRAAGRLLVWCARRHREQFGNTRDRALIEVRAWSTIGSIGFDIARRLADHRWADDHGKTLSARRRM